ncbi:MAG: hypothetical protein RM368_26770 [Nostoc sp. DedSLP03]|uniref:hypothetical protein n=1 Tax=Nostoc sp. DedSLP03 TaxID=3075400 RepID=UPI002AD2CAED|nr:hypothetical protein [Nostoc sp. DedSLP03]MDZ7968513.1 hypothetical protein [Nostoc sp. DedSLP03]
MNTSTCYANTSTCYVNTSTCYVNTSTCFTSHWFGGTRAMPAVVTERLVSISASLDGAGVEPCRSRGNRA